MPQLREALNLPKDKRTPEQQTLAKDAETQIKPEWDEVVEIMPRGCEGTAVPSCASNYTRSSSTAPDPLRNRLRLRQHRRGRAAELRAADGRSAQQARAGRAGRAACAAERVRHSEGVAQDAVRRSRTGWLPRRIR